MNEEIVLEINIGATMDSGAPLPMLFVDERRGFLVFGVLTELDEGHQCCTLEFASDIIKFGYPSDESLPSHYLFARGLKYYSVGEVKNSSWLTELYPEINPNVSELRHLVISFHDSTFECLARRFDFTINTGTVTEVFRDRMTALLRGARPLA